MFKNIIFLVLLWIKFIHAIKQCDDCVLYNSCPGAVELAKRKVRADVFRNAFCGYDKTQSKEVPKVCCSDFDEFDIARNPVFGGRSGLPESDNEQRKPKSCTDCVAYSSCPRAKKSFEEHKNNDIFIKAFCGYDTTQPQKISKVCCSEFDPVPIENHRNAHLLPDDDCGDINGRRIVGGTIAGLYEFPWMALIAKRFGTTDSFVCGGSIINSRYILTAAHCIDNRLSGVRVGDYDTTNTYDCEGSGTNYVCESHFQDIGIEEAIKHENFANMSNDIALLRLRDPIDFSHRNVAPICLPATEEMRNISLVTKKVTVAGWGKTETGRESSLLRKVEVPVMNWDTCVQKYERDSSIPGTMKKKNENQICAGTFMKDSCDGDSGGPLMLEREYRESFRMVQYGLVSFGPKRCGSNTPAIYTNVAKYMDWILDHIRE